MTTVSDAPLGKRTLLGTVSLAVAAAVFAVGLRLGGRRRVDGQKKAGDLDNTPGV